MLSGETVHVEELEEVGRTSHNEPVCEARLRPVGNVLVAPSNGGDISDGNRDGHRPAYTLYWPKADGSPVLDGLRLLVRGEYVRVVGSPRPYPRGCPTDWNMEVETVGANG